LDKSSRLAGIYGIKQGINGKLGSYMSFFRRIFYSEPSPISEECRVEFSRASESDIQSKSWLNRIVTFPLDVLKRVYNTYLLIRYAELRRPASKNICPMRWINSFPSLLFTMKITTIPSVMKAILKHPRKDPEEGLFDDRENAQVFLPYIKGYVSIRSS
jgi:hypothetical protein